MKQILIIAISASLLFFGVGLYLAHGADAPTPTPPPAVKPSSSTFPQQYTVPRISRTDPPQRIRESKSCREYLTICERSCRERGTLFKFQCIGQDFQPFDDHSRCICADDLFARREAPKEEQIQVKQEGEQ